MIPKVNLGVGEMGFMFCDLYLNMCLGAQKNHVIETLLLSTNTIMFSVKNKKKHFQLHAHPMGACKHFKNTLRDSNLDTKKRHISHVHFDQVIEFTSLRLARALNLPPSI